MGKPSPSFKICLNFDFLIDKYFPKLLGNSFHKGISSPCQIVTLLQTVNLKADKGAA